MTVLALFGAVKNLLRFNGSSANVANYLLLASRLFGVVLVICSILTTGKQFFGDPIACTPESTGSWTPAMYNSYCFMIGTSTWKHDRVQRLLDDESHPGLPIQKHENDKYEEVVHSYYQWIPFILFGQAIAFYLPYRLWKVWVGKKIDKLLAKISRDPLEETTADDQVKELSKFMAENPRWFDSLARWFFALNVLAVVQAVGQMLLIGLLMGGPEKYFVFYHNLLSRGFLVVVEELFPLVTSCKAHFINTGSGVTANTGNCVMNINILNQKIFVFTLILHYLFLGLGIGVIIWNILLAAFPKFRHCQLKRRLSDDCEEALKYVSSRCEYGQYILFSLLASNMDQCHLDSLIQQICVHNRFETQKKSDSIEFRDFRGDRALSAVSIDQKPMSRLHGNFGGVKNVHHQSKENLLPHTINDSYTESPTLDFRLHCRPTRIPVLPSSSKEGDLPVYSTSEKIAVTK